MLYIDKISHCCRVLHGVLHAALSQQDESGQAKLAEARRLAGSRAFQDALLNCAVELVAYAASGGPAFPDLTSRMGRLPLMLDLFDAVGHFGMHLAGTPPAVCGYLGLMRLRITEELAWRNGSSLFHALSSGGGGSCAAGDMALVSVRACCCFLYRRAGCLQCVPVHALPRRCWCLFLASMFTCWPRVV